MSVIVSLLEAPVENPNLTVMAASLPIENRVLGIKFKSTYREGVGFKVVESAMPVHVLSIQKHGRVFYFLPENKTSQVSNIAVQ